MDLYEGDVGMGQEQQSLAQVADMIRHDNEHPNCVGTCQRLCKTTICHPCYFKALSVNPAECGEGEGGQRGGGGGKAQGASSAPDRMQAWHESEGQASVASPGFHWDDASPMATIANVTMTQFDSLTMEDISRRVRRGHRNGASNYLPESELNRVEASGAAVLHRVLELRVVSASSGIHLDEHSSDYRPDFVNAVAYSPDGRRIVSASHEGDARVWELSSGRELREARFLGHEDAVRCAAFSPDGTCIASGSYDGTARVWDSSTGAELICLAHTEYCAVSSIEWAPLPRSSTVNEPTRLALSQRLVTASHCGMLRIWDLTQPQAPQHVLRGHMCEVRACHWSPDGTKVLSCSRDASVRLWDASSGTELRNIAVHGGDVRSCAFSPSAMRICTASHDGSARIFDSHGRHVLLLQGTDKLNPVNHVIFAPDGSSRLLATGWDYHARLYDTSSGELLRVLGGHRCEP